MKLPAGHNTNKFVISDDDTLLAAYSPERVIFVYDIKTETLLVPMDIRFSVAWMGFAANSHKLWVVSNTGFVYEIDPFANPPSKHELMVASNLGMRYIRFAALGANGKFLALVIGNDVQLYCGLPFVFYGTIYSRTRDVSVLFGQAIPYYDPFSGIADVFDVVFSKSGQQLAIVSSGRIWVFDLLTLERLYTVRVAGARRCFFLDNDSALLIASMHGVYYFDVTAKQLHRINKWVLYYRCCLSNDEECLAGISIYDNITIIDICAHRTKILTTYFYKQVCFSKDSSLLFASTTDGEILPYDVAECRREQWQLDMQ